MRKIFLFILVSSLLICQEIPFREEITRIQFRKESQELHNLINELSQGIVLCYLEGIKTTGFFISKDGWVLTNMHIGDRNFVSALKISVKLDIGLENNVYQSEKIIPHPLLDLLLIKINFKPKFYFKEFKNPYLFEENWILGFRMNSGKSLSPPGYVTSDTYRQDYFRSTAPGLAGNSGSPVINREGKVLGVCTMIYGTSSDVLFIPAEVVEKFIKENLEKKK